MSATETLPELILDRATERDLAVHAELEAVASIYAPPLRSNEHQGGLACANRPGPVLIATTRDDIYAVVAIGHKSATAARKCLNAVEHRLAGAGYPVQRVDPDHPDALAVLYVTVGGGSMTSQSGSSLRLMPLPTGLLTTTATTTTAPTTRGSLLGYARVSTGHQSLDAQTDALTSVGVEPNRVYSDKLTGTSTKEQRPGLAAVLDYAREGDTIVVVGIDRLGRNAAEVMLTIRELGERKIVLRSLREGIDTSNATGRMIAGVLASLAELELELGRERRSAAKAARKSRGLPIGRPSKLTADQVRQAEQLRASGEPVPMIAQTLGVSTPTMYRVLAERAQPN